MPWAPNSKLLKTGEAPPPPTCFPPPFPLRTVLCLTKTWVIMYSVSMVTWLFWKSSVLTNYWPLFHKERLSPQITSQSSALGWFYQFRLQHARRLLHLYHLHLWVTNLKNKFLHIPAIQVVCISPSWDADCCPTPIDIPARVRVLSDMWLESQVASMASLSSWQKEDVSIYWPLTIVTSSWWKDAVAGWGLPTEGAWTCEGLQSRNTPFSYRFQMCVARLISRGSSSTMLTIPS